MGNGPLLTVFTATYNRAPLLGRLYSSLVRQEMRDFEWLIVDDGSTDGTREKAVAWRKEGKVNVRYIFQPHGGKHRALNRALDEAHGEYLFIVDSDDWLADDALTAVKDNLPKIENREDIISLQFRTMNPSGRVIGSQLSGKQYESDFLSLRERDGISGDMAEIFKVSLFREHFRFPEIEGEDFMPEAIVWNRMAKDYRILLINKPIYYVEYQSDGLSAKIVEKRHGSPEGATMYYRELSGNRKIPFYRRWRAVINFWRFARKEGGTGPEKAPLVGTVLCAIGRLMKRHDMEKREEKDNKGKGK